MTDAEVVEELRRKLAVPVGRHLYGVLGGYPRLELFAKQLQQATLLDGAPFPAPLSVNRGILNAIPDTEFRELVEAEAKYPRPTATHVLQAFEKFLRGALSDGGLVILAQVELIFTYRLDLSLLRGLASDTRRIVLLLPGRRQGDRIIMFPDAEVGDYALPVDLIVENHLWRLSE